MVVVSHVASQARRKMLGAESGTARDVEKRAKRVRRVRVRCIVMFDGWAKLELSVLKYSS